ncbi:hypothetical protein SAMN05421640_1681 [Ekhidna lutea]|uniref:Uncharacterized protein n=1 Tax=Ekhidna lutea TaxID=447679 RepID=A0A239IHY8_EKHLU|nr:peptidoglycan-binding protein [Ekhidna lutea]SNS93366.1 hypothetical protein SAMN05421640_1681 [Ekhidna lutea]
MPEDPNITVARFNFKQAIVVAIITGLTTLGGTLLTMQSGKSDDTPDFNNDLEDCQEQLQQASASLENAITISSLRDISNIYFGQDANEQAVKNTIRELISTSELYKKDSQHYMHKLFRLKKLMLANGGNINVRVSNANKEACGLIQDLLKGIEYYKGSIDGNVESTRVAVEDFQKKLNNFTPGYFEEQNIGIVGKKTFNAILEHYERS